MAATVALVAFLVVLFGGLTVALSYGYLATERDRERAAEAERGVAASQAVDKAAAAPAFLPTEAIPAPVAFAFDEAFVSRLEKHVQMEQALIAQFVRQPSLDNLYRQTGARLHVH